VTLLFGCAAMALQIVALLSWNDDGRPFEPAIGGSAIVAIATVIIGLFALRRSDADGRRRIQLGLTLGVAVIAFWVLATLSVYVLGTE
jgi:hypothetical protein